MAESPSSAQGGDIVVVHSSDVHVDHDYTARLHGGDGAAGLAAVLRTARERHADLVLLAGDTFESHRLPADLLDRTAEIFAAAAIPIVLLPGNHDPAIPDAVFRHAGLAAIKNLYVLGVTHEEAVHFPAFDLEVWGRAHRDYADMIPFAAAPPRRMRWRIAIGHGHYQPISERSSGPRPGWLISDEDIAATAADYVALGHWNRAAKVGNGIAAYYSGSPDYAGTVNIVRLRTDGDVAVGQAPLGLVRQP